MYTSDQIWIACRECRIEWARSITVQTALEDHGFGIYRAVRADEANQPLIAGDKVSFNVFRRNAETGEVRRCAAIDPTDTVRQVISRMACDAWGDAATTADGLPVL